MEKKEVSKLSLPNGGIYSGKVVFEGETALPHGMGKCVFSDRNELGLFQKGKLNGIGHINYHDWMCVGIIIDGTINGWGIKAERKNFTFGIFEESKLKVNLTSIVMPIWSEAIEESYYTPQNGISIKMNEKEIFVGAPECLHGKLGFHFLENGEVFLGRSDYGQDGITGKFLHFDLDYNITKGEYKCGKLVRIIDDHEFVESCHFFVNHKYLDFDINMNYNPDSFFFDSDEDVIVMVVEAGKTPTNIILKANIVKVDGDRYECENRVKEDTLWFMFPKDNKELERRLMKIVNSKQPWMPDLSEYCVEFCNDFKEANNCHQIVYKHITCYDKDADYELDMFVEDYSDDEIIPNIFEKADWLIDDWKNGVGHYTYPSVRDYVISLAEGADREDFFCWLFDDSAIINYGGRTLPAMYEDAYKEFLRLLPN